MANRVPIGVTADIAALFKVGAMGSWPDSDLIAQFVTGEEAKEAAFRILIHRHGPMVLGVCRRVLGDEHAAEDAFQSTFIVFVKKAGGLRDGNRLTNWLYGVALRVAKKERTKAARRRRFERQAAGHAREPDPAIGRTELRSVIDEEIRRLPERYRLPLVLCHLHGLRHDEVAQRLGCPVGTIESRLSRARARLRDRLSDRGLAPTASVIAGILKPPGEHSIAASLVTATSNAAFHLTTRRRALDPVIVVVSMIKRLPGFVPTFRTAAFVGVMSGAVSVALVWGSTIYRAAGEPPRSDAKLADTQPTVARLPERIAKTSPPQPAQTPQQIAPSPATGLRDVNDDPRMKRAARSPSAIALPIRGITVDGRLDDWPNDFARYPIHNQLRTNADYNARLVAPDEQTNAYFMVGYEPILERIYLAVVVRDRDIVINAVDYRRTDAVEVYVDCAAQTLASGAGPQPGVMASTLTKLFKSVADPFHLDSSNNWRGSLDASKMPVIQYVGVPGDVAAYGDPWKANPSVVYGRQRQTTTKMKFQVDGDVITYEWSIQPFDRFPDRPAHFVPGLRLGLDVAVVDKDRDGLTKVSPPTYLSWASSPVRFKGIDPESLGDLLIDRLPDR
jgi:RNA polymerase sigma factor (sigma-70 family)